MHSKISLQDGVPIYRQIVNQVKYTAASGQLISGEEIPPICVLVERIHATSNAVAKRKGSGSFMDDTRSQPARKERRRIVEQWSEAFRDESRRMDFKLERTVDVLRQCEAALQMDTTKEHRDER